MGDIVWYLWALCTSNEVHKLVCFASIDANMASCILYCLTLVVFNWCLYIFWHSVMEWILLYIYRYIYLYYYSPLVNNTVNKSECIRHVRYQWLCIECSIMELCSFIYWSIRSVSNCIAWFVYYLPYVVLPHCVVMYHV